VILSVCLSDKIKTTEINAETEGLLPTNFKLGRRFEHVLSNAMASYIGLRSLVIAHILCQSHAAATQLIIIIIIIIIITIIVIIIIKIARLK